MSSDLVVLDGRSKMAEFHERLKDKLREHIAEMIPPEVVGEMAKQVVSEEFFKDTPSVQNSYGREIDPPKPSKFKQMISAAAEPFIKAEVSKFMVEHQHEIAKEAIEAVKNQFAASLVSTFISVAQAQSAIAQKLEQLNYQR
jgi:hypothetical protein